MTRTKRNHKRTTIAIVLGYISSLLITGCNSESRTSQVGVEKTHASSTKDDTPLNTTTTIAPFSIIRNNLTMAEAAASLGCMGPALPVPVNLSQYDDDPTFDDLFYGIARPWYVMIQDAGVASGKLVWGPDADLAFIKDQLGEYTIPAAAFTVASVLDPRWTVLSDIWRESLDFGVERFNSGRSVMDAAYDVVEVYGSSLKSACQQAIEGSIEKSQRDGLRYSEYIYLQLAQHLPTWYPTWFDQSSLSNFEKQFEFRDR
jgi:hypothetical protein